MVAVQLSTQGSEMSKRIWQYEFELNTIEGKILGAAMREAQSFRRLECLGIPRQRVATLDTWIMTAAINGCPTIKSTGTWPAVPKDTASG